MGISIYHVRKYIYVKKQSVFPSVVFCAELAMITNGGIVYTDDMTAPYDVGTVAIYSCNPDFVLRGGNVVRFCVDAGDGSGVRFDGEAPTCQLLVIPPDGK